MMQEIEDLKEVYDKKYAGKLDFTYNTYDQKETLSQNALVIVQELLYDLGFDETASTIDWFL